MRGRRIVFTLAAPPLSKLQRQLRVEDCKLRRRRSSLRTNLRGGWKTRRGDGDMHGEAVGRFDFQKFSLIFAPGVSIILNYV